MNLFRIMSDHSVRTLLLLQEAPPKFLKWKLKLKIRNSDDQTLFDQNSLRLQISRGLLWRPVCKAF